MDGNNMLLHIPHSSLNIPENSILTHSSVLTRDIIVKYTDLFTDLLFNTKNTHIERKVFPYNRFFCDVERLKSDPLEEVGNGIFYTHIPVTGEIIRTSGDGFVKFKYEKDCVIKLWENWQQTLKQSMMEQVRNKRFSYMIDCHSFSAFQAQLPEEELPDICVGYNNNTTQRLIDMTVSFFESKGYKVAENHPFSNSMTVDFTTLPHENIWCDAIMIEVNKRVYLDGEVITEGFAPLNRSINEYCNMLFKDEINESCKQQH